MVEKARLGGGGIFFVVLVVVTIVGSLILSWDMSNDETSPVETVGPPEQVGLVSE